MCANNLSGCPRLCVLRARIQAVDSSSSAPYSPQGWDQRSPLHEATLYGHVEVAEQLLNHGGNAMLTDGRGMAPRDLAEMNKNIRLVALFDSYLASAPMVRTTRCGASRPASRLHHLERARGDGSCPLRTKKLCWSRHSHTRRSQ